MSGAFLTNHFLFLHLPKTGGGTMCEIIKSNNSILNSRRIGDHIFTFNIIPDNYKNRSFFIVRNPWDYFVSQYEYGKQANDSGFKYQARNLKFKDFILYLCNQNYGQFINPPLIGYQSRFYFNFSYSREELNSHLSPKVDIDFFKDNKFPESPVKVYKIEDKMTNIIKDLNETYGIEMKYDGGINSHQTKRKPYQEYYDEETIKIVANNEKPIIDKFGYEF